MDPKMDSGCLSPGESLDDDYDVNRPLLPEEVLGIIDQLLCHEVGVLLLQFSRLRVLTTAVDGLALGLPFVPDPLHQPIPRGNRDAHASEDRRRTLHSGPR